MEESLMLFPILAALAAGSASAPHYLAEPERPPAQARVVARDQIWFCAGGSCSSAQGNSRPAIACPVLAREVGRLRSFAVAGQPMDAAALEKCNARAR
jgi:hypothetical protein